MDESRSQGFVLLHRRLRESALWQLKPSVLKLALYYIMEARWQDGKHYDGVHEIDVPAGSFVSSIRQLAAATGLSIKEIRTAQQHLEKIGFGAQQRARPGAQSGTLITVCNYKAYQLAQEKRAQSGAQSGAEQGHSRGTVTNTVKTDKTITPPYNPPPSEEQPFELEPDDPERLARKIEEIARRLHGRHRRRKCSLNVVKQKLQGIAKQAGKQSLRVLDEVDRCHEAWCRSRDWTQDDGEFQKSLDRWLAVSPRRWEEWPADVPQNSRPANPKPEDEFPWRRGASIASDERAEMVAALREKWALISPRQQDVLRKAYPELEELDG